MKKLLNFLIVFCLIGISTFLSFSQSQKAKTTFSLYFPKDSPHFCLLYYLSTKDYWNLYGTKVILTNTPQNATLIALKASDKLPPGYKILLKLSNFEPYSVFTRKPIEELTFKNKAIILPSKGSKSYQDVVEFLARQGLKPYQDYTPYFDLPSDLYVEAFLAGIGNLLIIPTSNPHENLTLASIIKAPDIGLLAVKDDIKVTDLKTIITAVYWGQKAFLKNLEPTPYLSHPPDKQKEFLLLLKKEGFFPENLIFNPVNIAIAQKYYQNHSGPFFSSIFYQNLLTGIKAKSSIKDYFNYFLKKIFSFS